MDGVGEINRRSVARQDDDLALGRERVYFLGIKVNAQRGKKIAGIAHLLLPLHQLAQPGEPLLVLLGEPAAVFVLPVRGDALLGGAVHLFGADLHFERLPVRPDHRSVQRLVEVRARDGDEVFDAPRHRPPGVVDDAQRRIGILHRVGNNAQREQVVDLVNRNLLPLELVVDAVKPFDAPFDARRDA